MIKNPGYEEPRQEILFPTGKTDEPPEVIAMMERPEEESVKRRKPKKKSVVPPKIFTDKERERLIYNARLRELQDERRSGGKVENDDENPE
jgi:hypothetical protein